MLHRLRVLEREGRTEEALEKVHALIESKGLEAATAIQQVADADKAAAYEAWFKSDVLGHKSNYRED